MGFRDRDRLDGLLCPHRGVGEENTLAGIAGAIALAPALVEFDVHLVEGELYLGHPPFDARTDATLQEALALYANTAVLPKIDLKVAPGTVAASIARLAEILVGWSPRLALINIDGEMSVMSAEAFMAAERMLIYSTSANALLNIDLGRYRGVDRRRVDRHVRSLARRPYSVSPNARDDMRRVARFARRHLIAHVHVWSFHDDVHTLDDLHRLRGIAQEAELQLLFDMKASNIAA